MNDFTNTGFLYIFSICCKVCLIILAIKVAISIIKIPSKLGDIAYSIRLIKNPSEKDKTDKRYDEYSKSSEE